MRPRDLRGRPLGAKEPYVFGGVHVANVEWMLRAKCRGSDTPDDWFPAELNNTHDTHAQRARRLCRGCPVVQDCLAYALSNNIQDGVWGGTAMRGRRRLKAGRPE
jgi:WhiB family redox-sensing transcriptional regulator